MENSQIMRWGTLSIGVNFGLMIVKILTGIVGNSYALIADGIESGADILTSLITWGGFRLSLRPPDENHPFGHGKIESLAGLFSGVALLGAGAMIGIQSVLEIRTPHHSPAWFTLPVLAVVVAAKELLSRRILRLAGTVESRSLEGDGWHHRSDALTSAAAACGIAISLIGGPAWAMADDWAALFACTIIAFNGIGIVKRSWHETLDGSVDPHFTESIRAQARTVESVVDVEKCLVRKSGTNYFVELHVQVEGRLTVTEGHQIGHRVKEHLMGSVPQLLGVVVHMEPAPSSPPKSS